MIMNVRPANKYSKINVSNIRSKKTTKLCDFGFLSHPLISRPNGLPNVFFFMASIKHTYQMTQKEKKYRNFCKTYNLNLKLICLMACLGHWQRIETQIRCRRIRHLIRADTDCKRKGIFVNFQ